MSTIIEMYQDECIKEAIRILTDNGGEEYIDDMTLALFNVFVPTASSLITKSDELLKGQYYFCSSKTWDSLEIHKCHESSDGTKYLGDNRIWATDDNPQAFDRWIIEGPVVKSGGVANDSSSY